MKAVITIIFGLVSALSLDAQMPIAVLSEADELKQYEENPRKFVYGEKCGRAGTDPYLRVELEKLLEQNDTTALDNWLESIVVEKRLYAVEGLMRLENDGLKLSENQLLKIKKVKKLKVQIWTCSGCIYDKRKASRAISKY